MQQASQVKQFWDSRTEQQRVELLTLDVSGLHRQAARLPGTLSEHIDKNSFLQESCDRSKNQLVLLHLNATKHSV